MPKTFAIGLCLMALCAGSANAWSVCVDGECVQQPGSLPLPGHEACVIVDNQWTCAIFNPGSPAQDATICADGICVTETVNKTVCVWDTYTGLVCVVAKGQE